MRFYSAASRATRSDEAAREMAEALRFRLGGPADLALLCFSPEHAAGLEAMADRICDRLGTEQLLGMQASALISGGFEIEGGPAACLLAARLPGAELVGFELAHEDWRPALDDLAALRERTTVADPRLLLILADPESTPTSPLLAALERAWPGLPALGGLASPDTDAGPLLLLGRRAVARGAVGLAIGGPLEIDLMVAQGCRPVGEPMRVTAAGRNLILALDDRPPLERLRELMQALPADERQAATEGGLFIGRAIEPNAPRLGRGDFLVREIIGFDQESGVMAVADLIGTGSQLQFQLRDARVAAEDLALLLAPQAWQAPPAGGLLFAGSARGQRLHGRPHPEVGAIRQQMGDLALGGCFCAGEIGPIHGRNRLHGQSLALALFRPAPA